jgi:hypothetical protein
MRPSLHPSRAGDGLAVEAQRISRDIMGHQTAGTYLGASARSSDSRYPHMSARWIASSFSVASRGSVKSSPHQWQLRGGSPPQ